MATIRVKHNNNYTVMSNTHFKEKDMSLKAKGLLSLMLSLPDDWDYTEQGLATLSSDGITSVKSALQELEKFGYLVRERQRNEKGQLADAIYTVYETPHRDSESVEKSTDSPMLENLMLGNPMLENQVQLNTNKSNTKKINNKNNKRNKKEKILDNILAKFALYDFSYKVQERLLDFYSDRIDAKQVPTDNQLIATLDLLASASESIQIQAIENSIRGGWKTIYLPKSSNYNNQSYQIGTDAESYEEQKQRIEAYKKSDETFTF